MNNTRFNHRQVWQLALPMIIANISTPLLGLVDTAVMGHLDNASFLAAVALAGLIFNFLFWGFGFLRMGTAGLSAQAFGANNTLELNAILLRAMVLAVSISFLLLVFQQSIAAFSFYLINCNDSIEPLAQQYFYIRIWSAPACLCQYVILGWFLGRQNTTSPLLIVVTTNACNICLDLLFVVHYGMNTEGVALASVLAEYIGLIFGVLLVIRNIPVSSLSLSWPHLLQADKIKAMLLINGHLFVRTLCLIFTFSFFTVQGAKFGSAILAANAILMNFQTFMAYALDGFAHAAEALIGRALGAKNKILFQQSIKTTALWSLLVALLFTLTFNFAGQDIINSLTHLTEVREPAYEYLPWLIALPLISFSSFLLDGVFIGATLSRQMRDCILLSLFLVFLPSWYYTQDLTNHGLWLALSLFMLMRTLIMLGYYLYYQRSIMQSLA
ncbi:MAG: MATE family efflux transporter [Gammaproteobacteria bacterium]|nr:MATE family efflux transporter [Gammaproteobacteria bacterium]MBT5221303.1 MATE family efflux transporter [Gammaproteobacteria bacterium]MBT6419192.1 MATE family efflux transporter [Gammaproteobacteria bacterium]MBT6574852.1 MATE family efflux transporter [Gammaproteobacteria bacterium]